MKYNSIYNNFASGELSRFLKGRSDLDEYFKGLDEMTNFLPIKQGGATLRPGTFLSQGVFTLPSVNPWAIFNFSPRDGEHYMVGLYPHGAAGDKIKIIRIDGATPGIVTKAYPWNRRVDFNTSATAYDRAADPDPSIILDKLQVIQNGDTLFILDGTGTLAPIVIIRTSLANFAIDSMLKPEIINPATGIPYLAYPAFDHLRTPYLDPNINTNIRLKAGALTGTTTITAQDASAVPKDFFVGDVVGMWIRLKHTGGEGVAQVLSKVSDSVVNVGVLINFAATTATTNWTHSAWNPRDGYPTSAAFFEQRLILGGSPRYSDTIWCSYTGNIYHFMQTRLLQDIGAVDVTGSNFFGATVLPADPFSFIPASTAANSIQWLFAADTLLVGTTKTEFSVTSGSDSGFGLDSVYAKPISSHGSSKVQPVKVGSAVLFVSSDGRRLMEIPKKLSEYLGATELSSISEGILDKAVSESLGSTVHSKVKNKIFRIVWQENESTLWCACKNSAVGGNTLITLTYDKTAKVLAWAKHKTPFSNNISSICVLPDEGKQNYDRLWLYIKRDGAAKYSLEFMNLRNVYDKYYVGYPDNILVTEGREMTYTDGTHQYNTDISNQHVNGTSAVIALDTAQLDAFPPGATYSVIRMVIGTSEAEEYLGEFTEVAGELTIPNCPVVDRSFQVGVRYDNKIVTMPIEAGAQFGVAQGSARRSHEMSVFLDRSMGGQYTMLKANELLDFTYELGEPTVGALFTGEARLSLNGSTDDHQLMITQNKPLPFTVLWLMTKGYTYDA